MKKKAKKKDYTGFNQFELWFANQFGGHPMGTAVRHGIECDLRNAIMQVEYLERILKADDTMCEYRKAALYAREAAKKKFKF